MSDNLTLKATVQLNTTAAVAAAKAVSVAAMKMTQETKGGTAATTAQVKAMASLATQSARAATALQAVAKSEAAVANANKLANANVRKKNTETQSIKDQVALKAAINEVTIAEIKRDAESARRRANRAQRSKQEIAEQRLEQQMILATARAEQQAAAAQLRITAARTTGLSTLRYALYDVTRAAALVGVALVATFVAPLKVAIDFQKEFANVQRTTQTTGAAAEKLKGQFIALSQTIPVSFKDLTEIGALAGQLGIATANITNFTRTVAMLTATTNLSINDAAVGLARIQALTKDGNGMKVPFENLASSILAVGVNSIATETQLVNTSVQLAATANQAGFTADQVIGLAGAFASLNVSPELARGTATRVFGQIARAISTGGEALAGFAKISGQSSAEFASSWQQNAGTTFQTLLLGLKKLDDGAGGAEKALRAVGITSVRDVPVLLRMATANDIVAQSFIDAAANITNTKALYQQYAIQAGTVAAKINLLANNVMAFLDGLGNSNLGFVGDLLDNITKGIKDMTRGLNQKNIFGQTNAQFFSFVAAATAVVGVIALLLAAFGRVAAGAIAARQAWLGFAGIMGITTTATVAQTVATDTLAASLSTRMVGGFAAAGAGATAFGTAISRVMTGTAIGILISLPFIIGSIQTNLDAAGDSGLDLAARFDEVGDAAQALYGLRVGDNQNPFGGTKVIDGFNDLKYAIKSANEAEIAFSKFAPPPSRNNIQFADGEKAISKFNDAYKTMLESGNKGGADAFLAGTVKNLHATNGELWEFLKRAPDVKGALEDQLADQGFAITNKNILALVQDTLPGYDKAVENSVGLSQDIIDTWGEGSDEVVQLSADMLEAMTTFTSFSDAYQQAQDANAAAAGEGATAAAVSIEQFLANYDAQIAKLQAFRANLLTLAGKLPAELVAEIEQNKDADLAALLVGANPEQLAQFIADWEQAGTDVSAAYLTGLMTFASGPFQSYLATLSAEQQQAVKDGVANGTIDATALLNQWKAQQAAGVPLTITLTPATARATGEIDGWIRGIQISRSITVPVKTSGTANFQMKAAGGPVVGPGTGTSDSIPTLLSNGEFVIRAKAAAAIGYRNLSSMNRMASGGPVGQVNSGSSGGSGVVELGPKSLGVLREALAREMAVYIGDQTIGKANDRYNKNKQFTGAN